MSASSVHTLPHPPSPTASPLVLYHLLLSPSMTMKNMKSKASLTLTTTITLSNTSSNGSDTLTTMPLGNLSPTSPMLLTSLLILKHHRQCFPQGGSDVTVWPHSSLTPPQEP